MKKLIEVFEIVIVVLVITFILNTYFFSLFKVYGSSMEPTYRARDILLVKKWGNVQKGDAVAFYETTDQLFVIKRVVGTPGDKIESDGNNILVNGEEVVPFESDAFIFTLLDDEYYLIGDNYNISKDSRHFGPVRRDFISGKVLVRIWPIFRRG